jgi:Na+/alanine symporter
MFLLIGWFWSIIWGCALVGHSSKCATVILGSGYRLRLTSTQFNTKNA